jgi:acyl-CoA synthetase (AMP-forming)/AMP-acid ligase II
MTDLQPWTSDRPDVGPAAVPMPEFVLEHASRFDDKSALVDGPTGRTLTYRQLAGGVERVAAGLAARGFGRGDVLALSSPNLPEYALALYGAMAAGGAVTGANPLLTAGELAGQLADAGASALVTVPPFLDVARAAPRRPGSTRRSSSARPRARPRSPASSPRATPHPTSGSTPPATWPPCPTRAAPPACPKGWS